MNQLSARRRIGVSALVATLFFLVSGGPFGLEDLLAKCGSLGAIAVLIATPMIWSVPTALLVGELGAALPEEGGFYAWVKRALGPFWGFQEAWLSVAASIFDMAIYPTLFVSYVGRLWPALAAPPWSTVAMVAFVVAAIAWNFGGALRVARGAELQAVLVIVPFAVLAALVVGRGSAPPKAPEHATDLLGGILVSMWNFMGWDNASTFAGEVDRPQRTYPRAVLLAVLGVTLVYLVPVSAVAIADLDVSTWTAGDWTTLAAERGGSGLALVVTVAGAVSSFAMFGSLTLSYSRLPVALAADGLLPPIFARTTKAGAPWVALIACGALWTASLGLAFDRLVMLDILLYGLSLVLELIALVALRVREPELPRPYRVPGGTLACALLAVPPTALIALSVVRNHDERFEGGTSALAVGGALIALGPALWVIARRSRRATSHADDA